MGAESVVITLAAVVTALAGGLTLIIKTMMSRWDERDERRSKEISARDIQITKLIENHENSTRLLAQAVVQFSEWEREEKDVHTRIVQAQQSIVDSLNRGLEQINARLDLMVSGLQGRELR